MKKVFGYWKEINKKESPYPEPKVNNKPWLGKDDFVTRLLKIQSYAYKTYFRGFSICRICKKINGSMEYAYKGYTWPEGYLHYIIDHNVKPEEWVIEWVLKTAALPKK